MDTITETPKRRGRPPGTGNPKLKLTCLVTGKSRASNINYLSRKADRLGVTIDAIVNNYVTKEALKDFVQNPSFNDEHKDLVLRLNGGKRIRKKKDNV